MIKKIILSIVCFGLAMSVPFDSVGQSGSVGVSTSASIKVTAHVMATGGMTRANKSTPVLTGKEEPFASGGHLFWLYHPRPGRVQVEVSEAGGQSNFARYQNTDGSNLWQPVQYPYVSLVEVKGLPIANDSITITLIYPDI